MAEIDSLSEAIQNLAQKKKQYVTQEALTAKKEQEAKTEHPLDNLGISDLNKKLLLIREFEESVNLLSLIFSKSSFDELALLIANPVRMLTLNLMIGVMRGVGFAIGGSMIAFFLLYLVKESLPPHFLVLAKTLLRGYF